MNSFLKALAERETNTIVKKEESHQEGMIYKFYYFYLTEFKNDKLLILN